MTVSVASVQILLTGAAGAPPDATVQAFIDDATALVALCPCIAAGAIQDTIIKYIAAHLYTVGKNKGAGGLVLDTLGDATRRWDNTTLGKGFEQTTYGQSALLYDTSGCLLGLGEKTAGFSVVTF